MKNALLNRKCEMAFVQNKMEIMQHVFKNVLRFIDA
jgi:hypothetical protein